MSYRAMPGYPMMAMTGMKSPATIKTG